MEECVGQVATTWVWSSETENHVHPLAGSHPHRTGYDNGEVRVWNFSSGACLCTLRPRGQGEEVTAMIAVKGALMKHIMVTGWDRKVHLMGGMEPVQHRYGAWPWMIAEVLTFAL